LPVLNEAKKIKDRVGGKVIAIDGRAASGKTTLADKLSRVLNAEVIRMDDFFLPPSLRTAGRLEEAGGNIHYERFCSEILPNLKRDDSFSYGVFDCGKMEIGGKREINKGEWRIVEGSYSHHPIFGDYADLRAFCSVLHDEQMKRIRIRNGEKMAARFENEWIPMEEKYFDAFKIREEADLLI
jgi:uridine kinase